jgi:hypothetical protein
MRLGANDPPVLTRAVPPAQAPHLLPALQALLAWAKAQGLAPTGPDSGLHPSGLLLWALHMEGLWDEQQQPAVPPRMAAAAAAAQGLREVQGLLDSCTGDAAATGAAMLRWLQRISQVNNTTAMQGGFRLSDPVHPGRWCVDLAGGADGGQVQALATAASRALQLLALARGSLPTLLLSTSSCFSWQLRKSHATEVLAQRGAAQAAADLSRVLRSRCGADAKVKHQPGPACC